MAPHMTYGGTWRWSGRTAPCAAPAQRSTGQRGGPRRRTRRVAPRAMPAGTIGQLGGGAWRERTGRSAGALEIMRRRVRSMRLTSLFPCSSNRRGTNSATRGRWEEFSGPSGYQAWAAARSSKPSAPRAWPAPFPRVKRLGSPSEVHSGNSEQDWCDDLLPYCAGAGNPAGRASHGLAIKCGNVLRFCTGRVEVSVPSLAATESAAVPARAKHSTSMRKEDIMM